jgi:Tol biopolymer transport system component
MAQAQAAPTSLIGYTEMSTNLPGGRTANIRTMRAYVVRADGTGRREVAPQLITPGPDQTNRWTQFVGWSPDGKLASIMSGWESAENAAWEEANQTLHFPPGGWLYDCYLVDLATGAATNLTSIDRVSDYNTGLFFWPKNPLRLGFTAMINGEMRPFAMNRDGSGKEDLSKQAGFAYGFSASADGTRIAYHQNYQVYLADADGSHAVKVETGNDFNFVPLWSPDGQWVEFLSGTNTNFHPWLVKRDGTGAHKLADRGDYDGEVKILDVPDFHGGSSDIPCWSADSKWIYYTAKIGQALELMRVSLDGKIEQLTKSAPGVQHYHPTASRDGHWLAFGATTDGVRQLYVSRADGSGAHAITKLTPGHGALWASWQPPM